MNTNDLISYYANLLIIQYIEQQRAYAMIQTVVNPVVMPQVSIQTIFFSPVPSSGAFTLVYDGNVTPSINWNDSAATIQGYVQALPGLSQTTIVGSIASGLMATFTGVIPPALIFSVGVNTLGSSIIVAEIDETLPLAVQNAFNLLGDNQAVGVQLDTIGKYAGVTRTSRGFTSQITLDDVDFRSLIQIATVQNSAGSSTAEITGLLYQFFPGQIIMIDRQTMEMDYMIASSVGSEELLQVFITEGLLPRPMAVRIRLIIYAPIINRFFGFRTYEAPAFNATPFNTYEDYHMDYPWLDYSNAIII